MYYLISESGQVLAQDPVLRALSDHVAAENLTGAVIIEAADIHPMRAAIATPDGDSYTITAGAWLGNVGDYAGLKFALRDHPTLMPKAFMYGHANAYTLLVNALEKGYNEDLALALNTIAATLPEGQQLTEQERDDLNALLDANRFNIQL